MVATDDDTGRQLEAMVVESLMASRKVQRSRAGCDDRCT